MLLIQCALFTIYSKYQFVSHMVETSVGVISYTHLWHIWKDKSSFRIQGVSKSEKKKKSMEVSSSAQLMLSLCTVRYTYQLCTSPLINSLNMQQSIIKSALIGANTVSTLGNKTAMHLNIEVISKHLDERVNNFHAVIFQLYSL